MEIKLFYSTNYDKFGFLAMEDDVNAFCSNVDVVDIKITSEGAENGHSYMIMVLYKQQPPEH